MAKERMLTVLVPIVNSDCEQTVYNNEAALIDAVPVSVDNINKIYKLSDGTYRRVCFNESTRKYSYQAVVDREFPYLGKPLEIFNFTYDATRMGSAPTISAQNVMWQAEKNSSGQDVTLENLWTQECHVRFNGENFYPKQTPTSGKSNDDERYKYDMDFVSERVVLETVYLYDVVRPFVSSRVVSDSSTFSFYGDISELIKRINSSLLKSGLASIELRDGVTPNSFLTYEEFNAVGLGTYAGTKNTSDPYPRILGDSDAIIHEIHRNVYEHFKGDYTKYLMNCVYVVENPSSIHIGPVSGGFDEIYDGDFIITGYQCVLGKDKKGDAVSSEEKLISFENNTIHEALQQVHDIFGLLYYIYLERDDSGNFTGNTIIEVADSQYDFADITGTNPDGSPIYSRDGDGIPTSSNPFDYGVDDALLSKEKTNTTEKIITRITGLGSEENIPWYYPNPTADGWIRPVYKRNDVELTNIGLSYPKTEGDTDEQKEKYERYLKNRIGKNLVYGRVINFITQRHYVDIAYDDWGTDSNTPNTVFGRFHYVINAKNITNPSIDFKFSMPSNLVKYWVELKDNTAKTSQIYKSTETYSNPTAFQQVCIDGHTTSNFSLTSGHVYVLYFYIWLQEIPKSQLFDIEGYLYPAVSDFFTADNYHYSLRQDFYRIGGLTGGEQVSSYANVLSVGYDDNNRLRFYCGYCNNNTKVNPLERVVNKKYKDITINPQTNKPYNKVYVCTEASPTTLTVFEESLMTLHEWIETMFNMSLIIWNANGWYLNNKPVTLPNHGMSITGNPVVKDVISFCRVKYVTPQSRLLPEVYIKSDGERRFYDAHNYIPIKSGTPDTVIGESNIPNSNYIINKIYMKDENGQYANHYDFENEFVRNIPKEHIEIFDDIKPTIEGHTRTITVGGVQKTFRIDVVEEFQFDESDNNEVLENSEDGNVSGEYKHPFFFAKLRPLGFNLFDLALQEDMVLSMTTGHCGACNFRIGVDENTKKNPVQIWEYDVYEGKNWSSKTKRYDAGELRRYVDTSNLYYDTTGTEDGYVPVDYNVSIVRPRFLVDDSANRFPVETIASAIRRARYIRPVYTPKMVVNGEVGSLKQEPKTHFDGDVKIGKFCDAQQDTTSNYVWVALYKDTDTYGAIMPSANPDNGDNTYSHYIDPKGHIYTDRKTGQTVELSDDDADKFVLINIKMPQVYLREAEHELSRKLVEYMYDNNHQKFNFTIQFSRIFIAQNDDINSVLNENSVLYVRFNNKIYRQYVKHYTYKMVDKETLPEISVDMNEELSVSRTLKEREALAQTRLGEVNARQMRRTMVDTESRLSRRMIGRGDDAIVGGNIVSVDAVTSFAGMRQELKENHFSKADFKILNGSDLVIGDQVHLPTLFKEGRSLRRNAWDRASKVFVSDATPIIPIEVTGTKGATNTIESSVSYANITEAFDQIDGALRCALLTDYILPKSRRDIRTPRKTCVQSPSKLWFQTIS